MTNLMPNQEEIKAIEVMAKNANESKFFQNLNGYGGIFSIAMFARELGLPVMQCLFGGMTNIQGKIEIAPRMMNAMIRKAGHQIRIIKSDDKICILKGIRKDTDEEYECTYGFSDAEKAGLASKQNYKNHPSDMLFARCMSRLARRLFADVIGSAYVEGEIDNDKPEGKRNNVDISREAIDVIPDEIEQKKTPLSEQQAAALDLYLCQIKDLDYLAAVNSWLKVEVIYDMDAKKFESVLKSLEKKVNKTQTEVKNESAAVA